MKIKTDTEFKSLYSTKPYLKDDIIHTLEGNILSKPSRTSIEIGENKHIEDDYGKYMNHSFTPNCKIENGKIVAICNISSNEELTFNYNENESNMAYPFTDFTTNKKVSGKQKIYVIRHGKALHNQRYHEIGEEAYLQRDTPLVEEGYQQAKKLHTTWDKVNDVELVLISPLVRTIETALTIFKDKKCKMIALDCLLEYPQSQHFCNMRSSKDCLSRKYSMIDFSNLSEDHKLYWNEIYVKEYQLLVLKNRIEQCKSFIQSRSEKTIALVSHSSFLSKLLYDNIGSQQKALKHCYPYEYKK